MDEDGKEYLEANGQLEDLLKKRAEIDREIAKVRERLNSAARKIRARMMAGTPE